VVERSQRLTLDLTSDKPASSPTLSGAANQKTPVRWIVMIHLPIAFNTRGLSNCVSKETTGSASSWARVY